MKISDRDKKLILFVLLVAIIALPIVFFIKPKNDKCKKMDNELVSLNERYNYLKDLTAKQADYEKEIARLTAERTAMIEEYPGGILQENTVMFLRGIEINYDTTRVEEISFVEPETNVVTEGSVVNGEYVEGLTSIKEESSIKVRGSYKNMVEIINYIFTYKDKMVLSSVSLELDKNTNDIVGVFVLDQYAVEGNGKEVKRTEIPSMNNGAQPDGRLFDLVKDEDGNIKTRDSALGIKTEENQNTEE